MKKTVLTIAAVIFALGATFATTIGDNPPGSFQQIEKVVLSGNDYPAVLMENNTQGTVYVAIAVDASGKASVEQIFSLNKDLQQFVKTNLESKDFSKLSEGRYEFKMTYKLL